MLKYLAAIGMIILVTSLWVFSCRTHHPESRENVIFQGLEESKRKFIWDVEHVTFEIESHPGRQFVEALLAGSFDQLESFCRPDFEADLITRSGASVIEKSGIVESEMIGKSDGSNTGDIKDFSSHFKESLSPFEKTLSGRLRVLKIFPEQQGVVSDTWNLQVLLTINGVNSQGVPVSLEHQADVRCRFRSDDEIKAGRIFEQWNSRREVLRTSRSELMEEVTSQVGLDQLPVVDNWKCDLELVRQYRTQTAIEDFDGDGHLDIAFATADGLAVLLQWDTGSHQFRNVSSTMGISEHFESANRSYLACWFDFDNDGDPDLLLGETLYRNELGKAFKPVKDNGGITLNYNPMGCVVADYDTDGLLDLYILYQRVRNPVRRGTPGWVGDDESGAVNQLWQNRGDGTFIEKTLRAAATGGSRHSFAATWLHANNDHYPDLYIANDFASNTLLLNRGDGTFLDISEQSGTGDFATSMGVASGDIDGDGKPEIYVANMYSKMGRRIIAQVSTGDYPAGIYEQLLGSCAGNRLYQTSGEGKPYRESSEQLGVNGIGWAYAPAFVDLDGDGYLDIYATTGFLSFNRDKPDG